MFMTAAEWSAFHTNRPRAALRAGGRAHPRQVGERLLDGAGVQERLGVAGRGVHRKEVAAVAAALPLEVARIVDPGQPGRGVAVEVERRRSGW